MSTTMAQERRQRVKARYNLPIAFRWHAIAAGKYTGMLIRNVGEMQVGQQARSGNSLYRRMRKGYRALEEGKVAPNRRRREKVTRTRANQYDLRARPINASRPLPSSQAAAGTGTDASPATSPSMTAHAYL